MTPLSRREFGALAVSAAAAPFAFSRTPSAAAAITARDLVERIKEQIGVAWKPESSDGMKVGDPSPVVAGVATTALPTLAVLQQVVKAGANVVISSQPVFYARTDSRTPPAGRGGRGGAATEGGTSATPPADPVFAAKNKFV